MLIVKHIYCTMYKDASVYINVWYVSHLAKLSYFLFVNLSDNMKDNLYLMTMSIEPFHIWRLVSTDDFVTAKIL